MTDHAVVSREDWLAARLELLDEEKRLTHAREALAAKRRDLPWVRLDKTYRFRGESGNCELAELLRGHSQLLLYHFMYGPDWQEGCPSCSFWADGYSGTSAHLAARDIAFAVVSRAPLQALLDYRARMGWDFDWYSSLDSDFNYDYHVSFTPEQLESGDNQYNYRDGAAGMQELPGLSVFTRDDKGAIYHSYSCYARGLDMMNSVYQHIDLTPRGRAEQGLPYPMAWLRRHDQYGESQ